MLCNNLFALVPIELLSDRRLSLEQMRVLIALLSFRNKNTDVVWPGREALADRAGGIHPSNVSQALSVLQSLGWVKKEGVGRRGSQRYRITVPDFEAPDVAESAIEGGGNVAESATSQNVAESATEGIGNVADSATRNVADSATPYIEHTIEHTNKSNIPCAGAREDGENLSGKNHKSESPAALLNRYGVLPEIANPWMRVRKEKRLAITPQALDAIKREAEKLRITLNDALGICCANGWGGFKSSWQEAQDAAAIIRRMQDGPVGAQEGGKSELAKGDWRDSSAGVLSRGKELGVLPQDGESSDEYQKRVMRANSEAQNRNAKVVGEFLRKKQQYSAQQQPAGATC